MICMDVNIWKVIVLNEINKRLQNDLLKKKTIYYKYIEVYENLSELNIYND